uniref:piggyBac transposable element-derived protein 3-like n=1 Tax=Styela clava TaxID=7725 RepID=UPI00193A8228|nr:piggyBac transposable element-derived protein 3-like [Styela clava]
MAEKTISVPDVIEILCIPSGTVSDDEADESSDIEFEDADLNEKNCYVTSNDADDVEPSEISHAQGFLTVEIHTNSEEDDNEEPRSDVTQSYLSPTAANFIWRKKKPDSADVDSIFRGPEFSAAPEFLPTPYWYFNQFMDQSVFKIIAEQTNIYAHQKNGIKLETNVAEIEQFIGIHMLMTVVKMPSYRMYWAKATRSEPIALAMGRKRFDKLRNYIHMVDNTNLKQKGDPDYDPLFKVRPVLEKVRKNCLKIEPEEKQSVDEQMIPFKGRIGMKQYIKNKPHKWGIKVFTRAGVSGLVYDFEIYTGKETVENSRGIGVGGEIVLRLVREMPRGLNYKCYFDNWFTSLELIAELKQMGILAVGTIGKNRLRNCKVKDDKELGKAGRGSYEILYETTTGLRVVKWYDNKAVLLASSYAGVEPVDKCERWSKVKKEYIQVDRPNIVKIYNQHMGGVDLSDMLMCLYRITIRPKRWYLRILYYLIDLSVTNAWLLYRRHVAQKNMQHTPLLDFRSEVADCLIRMGKSANMNSRKRGRPSNDEGDHSYHRSSPRQIVIAPPRDVRHDRFDHFSVYSERRGRCRKLGITFTMCMKCRVLLCYTRGKNCFLIFHTLA